MTINIAELKASLNKAYRLISPRRVDLDLFKKNLQIMLGLINEKETEEHVKMNLVSFLRDTFYVLLDTFYGHEYLISTKGSK